MTTNVAANSAMLCILPMIIIITLITGIFIAPVQYHSRRESRAVYV